MESAHRIQSILRRFERARIWVLGDAMLDEYVYGDVERISPDAPVQVVHVSSTEYRLGGAINVAHGIANLGADVEFLGVVGDDASGRTLRALAEQSGIGLSALGVQDRRQTIRKVRVVAQRQHVLRLDWEVVVPVGESFAVALFEGLKARAEPPDVIVVSDYAKGLLSSQFLSKVIAWARSKQVPVLVDPKVLDYGHYAGASLIKPNRRELEAALSKTLHDDTGWYDENVRPLLRRADIDAMLVTLGEDGMALVTRAGDIRRIRAPAREVYDVTGAGDTVIGTLALARAAGCDWEEACQISNSAAGLAVAKVGTAVVSRAEIAAALSPRAQMGCVEIDALVEQIVWWRMGGKRVVFTNGCFDLLHAGHLALLRGAASFGDVLVVGLNDDASVARLKGHDRPYTPLEERAALIAALDCVDAVVGFSEDTPANLIERVQPDVLVKGGDYRAEDVVGRETVLARGGRVEIIPQVAGKSTTALVRRARSAHSADFPNGSGEPSG